MAQPPADNSPDKQSPVTDPLMPDEDTLLDYINSYPVPPNLRKIAKAFKIGQDRAHRDAFCATWRIAPACRKPPWHRRP